MEQSIKSNQGRLRARSLWTSLFFVIIIQVLMNPHGIIMKDDERNNSIDTTKSVLSLGASTSTYFVNTNIHLHFLATASMYSNIYYTEYNQKVSSIIINEKNNEVHYSRGKII